MIGILGDVSFTVSSKMIRTFTDMGISNSPRYGTHDTLQGKPVLEFIGTNLDEINLNFFFRVEDKLNPLKEIKPLIDSRDKGEVIIFFLGSKKVGSGKFVITQLNSTYKRIDNKGNVLAANFAITLKEYVEPKISATGKKRDTVEKKNTTVDESVVADGRGVRLLPGDESLSGDGRGVRII